MYWNECLVLDCTLARNANFNYKYTITCAHASDFNIRIQIMFLLIFPDRRSLRKTLLESGSSCSLNCSTYRFPTKIEAFAHSSQKLASNTSWIDQVFYCLSTSEAVWVVEIAPKPSRLGEKLFVQPARVAWDHNFHPLFPLVFHFFRSHPA